MESGTSETRLPSSSPSHPPGVIGFAPGTLLAERYRVVALVGRGGMGEVYRADDLRLGQPVALKFLPPQLEANPFAREQLLGEVRQARTVSHPNVCRVYDVGDVHGRMFLTMEYIDGEDLASLLRRIGRLPMDKALEVARQLCAGLAAAHERGVLHRDLKPANVMIDGRGRVRITDFGLAVEVGEAAHAAPHGAQRIADVAGTVAYMAPERFDGAPATVQSDLYALGLVLYEIHTGRPAVAATTLEGWRHAHGDSTPSHPSALVTDIDPAVERAILRCLEKDPAKRPASAAQLGASLPGRDPLAAAIAAGETPSPELVAASGEEGTLPRRQAWLWFASCLVALVLAVAFGSQWQLANLAPLDDLALQRGTARQILSRIGYRELPADYASGYMSDDRYLTRLVSSRPAREWFTDSGQPSSEALYFFYRESPVALFTWSPFGTVSFWDPAPLYQDDVYLELDGRGRLVTLTAGGLRFRPPGAPASQPTDWMPLFTAAGLEMATFKDASVEWPSVFTSDESRAWEGRVGGRAVRVEASAYRGRPVQFVLRSSEERPQPRRPPKTGVLRALDILTVATIFASLLVLAVLARHNMRLGRGDRKGAFRLAVAVLTVETLYVVLNRHWTFQPIRVAQVTLYLLGLPLFTAAQTWLYYVGVEPFVRRRWPHLLIAWTRLLDARWRDPLVGRSVLLGTAAALLSTAVVPGVLSVLTRSFSLPLAVPRFEDRSLDYGLGWFFCFDISGWAAPVHALLLIAVLLVARMALRRDQAAWVALFVVTFGVHVWAVLIGQPWSISAPLAPVLTAAVLAATLVALMAAEGLLAAMAFYAVGIALSGTPLTYDMSRWYAWRTGVVVVLISGLALWGFRNVLGRQSAFPAEALDR